MAKREVEIGESESGGFIFQWNRLYDLPKNPLPLFVKVKTLQQVHPLLDHAYGLHKSAPNPNCTICENVRLRGT